MKGFKIKNKCENSRLTGEQINVGTCVMWDFQYSP